MKFVKVCHLNTRPNSDIEGMHFEIVDQYLMNMDDIKEIYYAENLHINIDQYTFIRLLKKDNSEAYIEIEELRRLLCYNYEYEGE